MSIWYLKVQQRNNDYNLINELRRDIYEQMRFQTSSILTALSGKIINPLELFPLKGDEKVIHKNKPITKDRFEYLKHAWIDG